MSESPIKERSLEDITLEIEELGTRKGRRKITKGVSKAALEAANKLPEYLNENGIDITDFTAHDVAAQLYKEVHERVIGKVEGVEKVDWKGKVKGALGKDYGKFKALIMDGQYLQAAAMLQDHFENEVLSNRIEGLNSEYNTFDADARIPHAKKIAEGYGLRGMPAPDYVKIATNLGYLHEISSSYNRIAEQAKAETGGGKKEHKKAANR